MARANHSPRQQCLPMDLPQQAPEGRMRELFERRWSRWHAAKSFEEAVADPITYRLLALAVQRGAVRGPSTRGRRR